MSDGIGLEVVVGHPTDDRAHEGLETAENREKNDLAREGPVENIRGREAVQRHPEGTSHSRVDPRDQEGDPPIAPYLDPDELGARLVVADGLKRLPERRVDDDPHHRHTDEKDDQHIIIVAVGQKDHLFFPFRIWDAQ